HAARRAGGKDDARDHFNNARVRSEAKTDLESSFQPDCGARRTAIISATTLTAISSGDSAPISSPMGAKIDSNACRGIPSFSSSLITEIVLRLLPIMEIYFAGVDTAQRSTRISSRWPRVTMMMYVDEFTGSFPNALSYSSAKVASAS